MNNVSQISDMIRAITQTICDFPEKVDVIVTDSPNSVTIDVVVCKEDLGKMIGKNGKTATAIRTIVYCAGFKTSKRFNIDFSATK